LKCSNRRGLSRLHKPHKEAAQTAQRNFHCPLIISRKPIPLSQQNTHCPWIAQIDADKRIAISRYLAQSAYHLTVVQSRADTQAIPISKQYSYSGGEKSR
jgi:hypothetical protein